MCPGIYKLVFTYVYSPEDEIRQTSIGTAYRKFQEAPHSSLEDRDIYSSESTSISNEKKKILSTL